MIKDATHNVELAQDRRYKCGESLRASSKMRLRKVGRSLGRPRDRSAHPFPGPGLRIPLRRRGDAITPSCDAVSDRVRSRDARLSHEIWQRRLLCRVRSYWVIWLTEPPPLRIRSVTRCVPRKTHDCPTGQCRTLLERISTDFTYEVKA